MKPVGRRHGGRTNRTQQQAIIGDIPLVGLVALMALLQSLWHAGFFHNVC